MKQLVTLRTRPSRDGRRFVYMLDYVNDEGKRQRVSLGHADKRKAKRQRDQKEREIRMGITGRPSMRLTKFLEHSLELTRGQVKQNTLYQASNAMKHLISAIGNVDYTLVRHHHGERCIQACLDGGNKPSTAGKKLRHLKRLFQLAVERGQLDENPFRYVKKPRVSRRKIRVLNDRECSQLIQVTRLKSSDKVNWHLLIETALCTGLRRGELLNATWWDIDFDRKTIDVSPKVNTDQTWEWHVKDTDRRTLPLTDELVQLFAEHQAAQPEGYTYIFVPPSRYDRIQGVRKLGQWDVERGKNPLNNFDRFFKKLLKKAAIEKVCFHDLRRTCITNWFANGLREHDVMNMAGHASFETTRQFYLAIRDDLLDRTRVASAQAMENIFGTHLARTPNSGGNENGCQT